MNAKTIFKTMAMAVLCLSSCMLVSCGDDDPETNKELVLNALKVELAPGATTEVTAYNGAEPITAKSGSEKIATATVDKNIITVQGVAEGSTTILVSDSKQQTARILVWVKAPTFASLSFDKSDTTVGIGEETVVSVLSGTAPYTVKSSDEEVATASISGLKITIKGIKVGITTLTVTDANKRTGLIFITVK